MKSNKNIILVILIVLILSILLNFYLLTYDIFSKVKPVNNIVNEGNISDVLSLDGFVEIGINVSGQQVILIDNCTIIAATTTDQQAYSIERALTNRFDIRPTTHDLMKNIFENFGIEILRVKIVEMHDGNYFADFILKQGNKILNLDAKPTDGIAVALRMNVPIYIKKELMDNYGQNVC